MLQDGFPGFPKPYILSSWPIYGTHHRFSVVSAVPVRRRDIHSAGFPGSRSLHWKDKKLLHNLSKKKRKCFKMPSQASPNHIFSFFWPVYARHHWFSIVSAVPVRRPDIFSAGPFIQWLQSSESLRWKHKILVHNLLKKETKCFRMASQGSPNHIFFLFGPYKRGIIDFQLLQLSYWEDLTFIRLAHLFNAFTVHSFCVEQKRTCSVTFEKEILLVSNICNEKTTTDNPSQSLTKEREILRKWCQCARPSFISLYSFQETIYFYSWPLHV